MANKLELIYLNLGNMLEAGLPVVKALRTAGNVGMWKYRRAFTFLADQAAAGSTIAEAMEQRRGVFRLIDRQLVHVGETSGGLPRILKELGKWYGLNNRIRAEIRSRLMMPLLQYHFVILFVPSILMVMNSFSQGAMGMTQDRAIALGIALASILYVPATFYVLVATFTPQTGPLRYLLDIIVQIIPALGAAMREMAYGRYFRNFELCLKAGVPILNACDISLKAVGNGVVAQRFKGGAAAVKEGSDVSEGFRHLPDELRYAWVNGELTGDLDVVCERLANNAFEKAERAFRAFAKVFSMFIAFVVVCVIVYCIFLMFSQMMTASGLSEL